jgi:hypothetical protein
MTKATITDAANLEAGDQIVRCKKVCQVLSVELNTYNGFGDVAATITYRSLKSRGRWSSERTQTLKGEVKRLAN